MSLPQRRSAQSHIWSKSGLLSILNSLLYRQIARERYWNIQGWYHKQKFVSVSVQQGWYSHIIENTIPSISPQNEPIMVRQGQISPRIWLIRDHLDQCWSVYFGSRLSYWVMTSGQQQLSAAPRWQNYGPWFKIEMTIEMTDRWQRRRDSLTKMTSKPWYDKRK